MKTQMTTLIKEILQQKPIGEKIEVKGWVRTRRDIKGLSFIEINDGSCLANLQIIAAATLANYNAEIQHLTTGCSLCIRGTISASPAKGQEVEVQADTIKVYGWSPAATYPLQKKRHSFEFLRSIAHLRPRTNSLGAVSRIRSGLAFAVHSFFQARDFIQVHTPIITTSDCEGAGEMFTVSALDLNRTDNKNGFPFSDDFFGRQANLTVSGQLEAEAYALALGRVYTFGPSFRAENSNTSRHLAEFWMIEPEMAFCNLNQDADLAEELLKHLVKHALDNFPAEIELFAKFIDKTLPEKLENVVANSFARLTYGEAVDLLAKSGKKFNFPATWGSDLQSEHERYLAEEVCKCPLIVTDYPKDIKPFYMRLNDDDKTVAAMDILFPALGEIVGGSQREERLDILAARMDEAGINKEDYSWYLDLRRYGSVEHAGFGVGFERIVQFITGMANIRETIPFPRTPGGGGIKGEA